MTRLAARTIALFAAGALLASCGGSDNGNGSSTIDQIQDSVSEGTGLDIGNDGPPQGTPEELLLSDVQVAGYDFTSETVDLEQIRTILGSDLAEQFQIEPPDCDASFTPANLDNLSPETMAMRMGMTPSSAAAVAVTTETTNAQNMEEDLERCGEMTLRSDIPGFGEMVLDTTTETFDVDAPSGVDDVVGFTQQTTGTGPEVGGVSMSDMMPASGTVSISGVVRERAVFVHLSGLDDSATTEQLQSAAQEVFTAQVDKVKDAE